MIPIPKKARTVLLAAIVILTVLASYAGVWLHGNYHGEVAERAANTEKQNELNAKLFKLQTEARKKERDVQKRIDNTRRQDDERIKALLQENRELRDWWDNAVPADAIAHAYGMRNDS